MKHIETLVEWTHLLTYSDNSDISAPLYLANYQAIL